jgi:hypothetical protein
MMNTDNSALTPSSSVEEINRAIEGQLMRVIYRSRSLMKEGGEEEVLKAAHRNNPALDVTGVLVSNSGWFIQVLEGPGANVKKLLDKIEADTRHTDFYVISTGGISERNFKEWSMASVSMDPLRFGQLVKDCMKGENQALDEVRNFLCFGKWT